MQRIFATVSSQRSSVQVLLIDRPRRRSGHRHFNPRGTRVFPVNMETFHAGTDSPHISDHRSLEIYVTVPISTIDVCPFSIPRYAGLYAPFPRASGGAFRTRYRSYPVQSNSQRCNRITIFGTAILSLDSFVQVATDLPASVLFLFWYLRIGL